MPKSPAQRYVNTGGRVLRTDVPEWMRTGRTIGDAATPDGNDIGTRSTLRWLCQQGAKDTIPTRQYTTTAGRATGVYPAGGGMDEQIRRARRTDDTVGVRAVLYGLSCS